jgi:hypothetical protein
LQHTPSTHERLWHSPSREQLSPFGERGVHTPARQNVPSPHEASVVQPWQAVAPQIPVPQSWVRTGGHEPDPSQFSGSVATLFVQLGARHGWVDPGMVHD